MCLVVFKIYASFVLTHYVPVFCVTLWQPAVFYSVLVLYLRTQNILKPTYLNDYKHYSQTYCCFGNQFSALSDYIGSTYKEKKLPFKRIVLNRWGARFIVCIFCLNMLTLSSFFFYSYSSMLFQSSFQKEFRD
jgi:hypothetical protein